MRIWSVGEKRTVHSSTQFPKTDVKCARSSASFRLLIGFGCPACRSTAQRLRMCWSPDGKHLALPGQREVRLCFLLSATVSDFALPCRFP
jgi:hypothetical protein